MRMIDVIKRWALDYISRDSAIERLSIAVTSSAFRNKIDEIRYQAP